ncbi:hypothetical protein QYE76_042969 [Lolium multiflorum]|uniref:Ribonuclease H1 N-terminal domain-containing protein n=1 Tax=Lolium multiflorum TaxID=4521 RepID=A0AAD8TI81_LOLMU|nr:hypothetical protein QYE76_042969 [Lolium multiflorum]
MAYDMAEEPDSSGGGLPSGKKSTGATSPIIRPKIASADDTLKETAVAAPTTLKEPAVAAATRKEPTIAVTTRRHKQLLGALPQRPSTRRTVRQATASQPPPPKVQDMAPLDGNDVEDDDDIDAYINTGACSQDMYMPPMDEQAFRTHGDQLSRPPTVTKQRLVFTGLSQDTPPEAGNPAQVKPATVFSPNTLRKTIIGEPPKSTPATSEAPPAPEAPPSAPQAPPVGQAKKGRKRGGKKGASSSQPAPKRIRADDMVPPTPDGLPRCHEAGKPILPPDMEHLASGPMLPLQHCIQYQESVLLKEKDPNYPVFSVKVPSDQHFVNEDPADIFFIAFEDVFNLFHSKRLDYNLVRLYAINLQMKINRERPPHIAVADPYYMRDSQLQDGSSTRTKAVRYLESFMLMNKEKNTILLPVFPEDKYCTLIILCPKWSLAQYFDSSNTTTKKDYRRIRGVLDEAILGYSKNGGTFDKKGEFVRPDTKKLGFKHVIDFPCIKQPAGSIKEAFYVLHHLKGFVEDAEMMSLPPSKRDPIKMSGEINDDDLREDFHRLQMTYYVVFEGRVPGVYEEWEECKKQVHKFSGNCYKGYPTRHEAVAKWRAHQAKKSKMKTFLVLSLLLTIVAAGATRSESSEDSSLVRARLVVVCSGWAGKATASPSHGFVLRIRCRRASDLDSARGSGAWELRGRADFTVGARVTWCLGARFVARGGGSGDARGIEAEQARATGLVSKHGVFPVDVPQRMRLADPAGIFFDSQSQILAMVRPRLLGLMVARGLLASSGGGGRGLDVGERCGYRSGGTPLQPLGRVPEHLRDDVEDRGPCVLEASGSSCCLTTARRWVLAGNTGTPGGTIGTIFRNNHINIYIRDGGRTIKYEDLLSIRRNMMISRPSWKPISSALLR